MPCPISERAMRITQVSSGLITTQALTSVPRRRSAPAPRRRRTARASRAPGRRLHAAEPTMKLRRESCRCSFAMMPSCLMARPPRGPATGGAVVGRHMHGGADALVGAAAADVGHRLVDVRVGRLGIFFEQRRGRHDLARLAVAALRHVDRRPRLLHRMRAVGRQALDGDDLVGRLHVADTDRARALHLAVDVHRAGAALRDAAAVLGAGQADLLADDPQAAACRPRPARP